MVSFLKNRSHIILIILTLLFTGLAFLAKHYPYFPIDLVITRPIQKIQFPFFAESMSFVTQMGNVTGGVLSVGIFILLSLVFHKKKVAFFILISVLGATLIGLLAKLLVGRPRPAEELLLNYPGYLHDTSFPSGHVLFFMGLYGLLLYIAFTEITHLFWRRVSVALCLVLICLIGVSRMYVGAHWFSDTLGSYMIGSVWLIVIIHFYRKQRDRDS